MEILLKMGLLVKLMFLRDSLTLVLIKGILIVRFLSALI